jgi:hypothetical protein
MKLGITTLLATALAALLLVPAVGAKPGNGNGNGGGGGNGNGQGPPAWAGGGKPDQAEKDARKAAQRAAKADRRAARAPAPDAADDEPRHPNPAWICKFEREQKGAEAFAEEYGTNDNKANAFGMCVSREAQDRDGVDSGDEETPEPDEETPEPTEPEAPEDEGEPSTAAQAFFAYLWPFLQA